MLTHLKTTGFPFSFTISFPFTWQARAEPAHVGEGRDGGRPSHERPAMSGLP